MNVVGRDGAEEARIVLSQKGGFVLKRRASVPHRHDRRDGQSRAAVAHPAPRNPAEAGGGNDLHWSGGEENEVLFIADAGNTKTAMTNKNNSKRCDELSR